MPVKLLIIGGVAGGATAVLLWQDAAWSMWSVVMLGNAGLPLAIAMSAGACLLGSCFPAWMAIHRDVAVVLSEE